MAPAPPMSHERPPTFYKVELRGVKYLTERSQSVYGRLRRGEHLMLEREPDNKADPKALLVLADIGNGLPVGWVQRPINEEVTDWILKGYTYMAQITHRHKGTYRRHLMKLYPLATTKANATTVKEVEVVSE